MSIPTTDSIHRFLVLSFALLLLSFTGPGIAAEAEDSQEEEEKPPTIAELTEDATRHDGLFTLFRDNKTGATHMLIQPEQLDREYIYSVQIADGVVEAGILPGSLRRNRDHRTPPSFRQSRSRGTQHRILF